MQLVALQALGNIQEKIHNGEYPSAGDQLGMFMNNIVLVFTLGMAQTAEKNPIENSVDLGLGSENFKTLVLVRKLLAEEVLKAQAGGGKTEDLLARLKAVIDEENRLYQEALDNASNDPEKQAKIKKQYA